VRTERRVKIMTVDICRVCPKDNTEVLP